MIREPVSATFQNLDVYRVGIDFAVAVYEATKLFPSEERFGLTSQLRRASVSIPSNIAEGWGRGRGADNVRFVRIARGSSHESLALLQICDRLELLQALESRELFDLQRRVGQLIQAYLTSLERHLVCEDIAPYDHPRIADSD